MIKIFCNVGKLEGKRGPCHTWTFNLIMIDNLNKIFKLFFFRVTKNNQNTARKMYIIDVKCMHFLT